MSQQGIKASEQAIQNSSFNPDTGLLQFEAMGWDGVGSGIQTSGNVAIKITESGTTTYVAKAAPGTLQATAKWQVRKIDESSGLVITWAGGTAAFNQVATDLTSLTYS